ncbi:MAG: AI-2E family transporter [bacterium]|nr:AI-2E family transporter [bacterium]
MALLREKILTINVSTQTFIKILVILAVLWFLYLISDVLALLFVAFILSSALTPWVNGMHKYKIPRVVSILLIYVSVIAVITAVVLLLIPALAAQISQMALNFPIYSERLVSIAQGLQTQASNANIIEQVKKGLAAIESGLLTFASGLVFKIFNIIGGFVALFVVLVLSFYMTVEESVIQKAVTFMTPAKYHDYATHLINRVQKQIGLWLRAQMILSFIIFLLSYIGLSILGVDYALTLALVAGLTEFVPVVGPILGAVPAVFIGLNQSPWLALWVILLYLVIQRLENDLLVPKVMQHTVGLNPLISIIALLIGAKLGGIVGAMLAIPVTTAISVVVSDFFGEAEKAK